MGPVIILVFIVFVFSERCENPENFEDYDICGGITADMCDEPDYVDMFAEFCPTVCSCSKYYCSMVDAFSWIFADV